MFGTKELDLRNVYNPDLQDIQESAERTYGEANSFYRKEEVYLKDIEARILSGELLSEKDIYDECHAIASDLAKCCEMYLKALYIYEHNIPGNQIDNLWERLKKSEFQEDEKGNLIYKTSTGKITFVKYDEQGNPIKDSNGKILYFDNEGNTYTENNRGSKIKRNGHQLDRLIELLSPDSRLLLETRMLTIPMESTEKNHSVSLLDVLIKKGVISQEYQISSEQYEGWIEQHKKTFEEARYSGQKQYDISVEFLYHLATQIKAVAQYKIQPKNNQIFTLTDEEISKLSPETKELVLSRPYLMSENLIRLIDDNPSIKEKIIMLLSENYLSKIPEDVSPFDFCDMLRIMNAEEIKYVISLIYLTQNYDKFKHKLYDSTTHPELKETIETAEIFRSIGIIPSKIMGFLVQLKEMNEKDITICNKQIIGFLKIKLIANKMEPQIYKPEYLYKIYSYYNLLKDDDYTKKSKL